MKLNGRVSRARVHHPYENDSTNTMSDRIQARSGKWSSEEESFANCLIVEFERGTLEDCEDGCTLRSYLSRRLNCAPMRISKKFAGRCIGKLVFASRKVPKSAHQNQSQSNEDYGHFDDIESAANNNGGGNSNSSASTLKQLEETYIASCRNHSHSRRSSSRAKVVTNIMRQNRSSDLNEYTSASASSDDGNNSSMDGNGSSDGSNNHSKKEKDNMHVKRLNRNSFEYSHNNNPSVSSSGRSVSSSSSLNQIASSSFAKLPSFSFMDDSISLAGSHHFDWALPSYGNSNINGNGGSSSSYQREHYNSNSSASSQSLSGNYQSNNNNHNQYHHQHQQHNINLAFEADELWKDIFPNLVNNSNEPHYNNGNGSGSGSNSSMIRSNSSMFLSS